MSAVTAVPLRPLAPRSVLKLWVLLALLVAVAAGLAWWGTRSAQIITLESGARFRVVQEGSGSAFTSQDAAEIHLRVHVNSLEAPLVGDTAADDDGPVPVTVTYNQMPPGLRAVAQNFHTGGRYILWIPAAAYLGGAAPPRAPFTGNDTLVFEIQVLQIAPGQAMALETRRLQQMMQQAAGPPGGGPPRGPGGPGATPPPAGGR